MNSYISERLAGLSRELSDDVQLVAVSKYFPVEDIRTAYEAGQRVFGESRAQEICAKLEALPEDIEWHFIGHLQPNKVKYIAPFVSLIHAVDSIKLLMEIDKQGRKCQRQIPCLLQLHVAQETSKYGFLIDECYRMLQEGEWRKYPYARISGIMCMASHTEDEERVRQDFNKAHDFFKKVKQEFFFDDAHFRYRSWGMSGDYRIAIEEGANLVRIGSLIFEK